MRRDVETLSKMLAVITGGETSWRQCAQHVLLLKRKKRAPVTVVCFFRNGQSFGYLCNEDRQSLTAFAPFLIFPR